MKNNLQISTFDSYIIRKPMLSFNTLFNNVHKTANLDDLLKYFISNNLFLTSIFWSSSTVYETILKYKLGTLSLEKEKRLLLTLRKFLVRATTRCTPYGTFSGISIKEITDIQTIEKSTLIARIDYELIFKLARKIESDSDARNTLRFRINPTVSKQNKKFCYLALVDNEYHLNYIESTDIIDILFKTLKKEYYTINSIIKLFSNEFTCKELYEFITELIKIEFLQSEISPLRYSENAKTIHAFLRANNYNKKFYFCEQLISDLLWCTSAVNDDDKKEILFEKITMVKKKLAEIDVHNETILQIDLLQNTNDVKPLNTYLLGEIQKTIKFLYRTNLYNNDNIPLSEFKKKFISRYDQSEQHLIEVLDPATGIGFPSESAIGIHYNDEILDKVAEHNFSNGPKDEWADEKLIDIIEQNIFAKNIDLAVYNFDQPIKFKSLPPTFYALGNIISENHFFLQNIGGTSAKTLFSRFTHLNKDIQKLYNEISTYEKEYLPEMLICDIIFIPNSKVSNVTRPQNPSEYEITIAGENLNSNVKININDLYVSVKNDEVILRSESLNKRIIPRLSNAHNFSSTSSTIYNFLSSVQHQGITQLGIQINQSASRKRYIPRISYNGIILRQATWIFFEDELLKIKSGINAKKDVRELFEKWNVPQFVSLSKDDNDLFLDIHNDSYLEILLHELKKSNDIKLVEWIFETNSLNEHINQIIIPFKNIMKMDSPFSFTPINNDKRIFIPGSQWVYFKFYCGSIFSDELLSNYLFPVLKKILKKKLITKFFFIRYADPDYHIRFRVYTSRQYYVPEIIKVIFNSTQHIMVTKEIWKYELSTYEREIERYHTQNIDTVEKCFMYDTMLISDLLTKEKFKEDSQFRLLLAIKNIDCWLSVFDLDIADKINFCKKVETSLEKEFTKKQKKNIHDKYRKLSNPLNELMNDKSISIFFENRDKKIKSLHLEIENIFDFIHMSVNRWFPSEQRLYEYIIYIFAIKYYLRTSINNKNEKK